MQRGYNQDAFKKIKKPKYIDECEEYWYIRGYQSGRNTSLPLILRDGDRAAEWFRRGQSNAN